MTLNTVCLNTKVVEETVSYNMWSLTQSIAKPHIDIGLSKMDGKQLRMGIGKMKQAHTALLHWTIVEGFRWILICQCSSGYQTGSTCHSHQANKFASTQ